MKAFKIIVLSILMLSFSLICVYAENFPIYYQGDRVINIHLKTDNNNNIEGSTLYLYKIASVNNDGTKFYFEYDARFNENNKVIDDVDNVYNLSLSKEYLKVIDDNKINYVDYKTTDTDGLLKFELDEDGLYLIVQRKANADGYIINPFIVSMPSFTDGAYGFEIDASPKVSIEKVKNPENPGDNPSKNYEKLPQTGQLSWPIPLLSASGIAFIIAGYYLKNEKKK